MREPDTPWWQSSLVYEFGRSPVAVVAAAVAGLLAVLALGADLIAPYDSYNPPRANVADARLPPRAVGLFRDRYLLRTHPQRRDILSAMIYGLRTSLLVGLGAVLLAAVVGIVLGLVGGYFGGLVDTLIMRVADVQLSFPAILIALLIDGVTRTVMDRTMHDKLAVPVLVL